jgi:hypothetical protein
VQLTDLAFGARDNRNAQKGQLLVNARGCLLIAREAVQRLGDDDIERLFAGVDQQALKIRPQCRGTRNCAVAIDARDLPTAILDELGAVAHLVVDRSLPLPFA